jgi:MerR family transcriptional regulator, light-induced transcriptional regulator
MNQFTIKDIENLTGIKAHTWRIWEQRYNIAIPQRKDSNHRFYDNENLKQILRISYLYNSGIKVSKIARLQPEEMKDMALIHTAPGEENEFYIKELLEASLDFDEERFERNFIRAINDFGFEEAILKILYPYQERVGVLWLTDHVIPAQEHFTSNIIRQKLIVAIDELPGVTPDANKQIILFTPEDEMHELPLMFIHYLLKKNGKTVVYFGGNVSLNAIKAYEQGKRFTHMFFHLITNFTGKHPDDYLEEVAKLFPDKEIIMSGNNVRYITRKPENVRLLNSMQDIVSFTKEDHVNSSVQS